MKAMVTLDPAAVDRALNTVLDSEMTKELIDKQIRGLAENTLKTRSAFEEISRLLGCFDSMRVRDAQNRTVETLRPGWETLRTTFNDIVEESHQDAIKIKVVCDEYIQVILSILDEDGMSLEDVKEELQYFIENTDINAGAAKTATEQAKHFDALSIDVNKYKEKIGQTFELVVADPEGKIASLTQKLRGIRAEIAKKQGYMDGVLGIMAPAPGIFSFFSAEINTITEDLLRESKKELKATESALTILQARATTMKDLQKQLVESQSSLETMASQIRALSNFWIAIKADCMGAVRHLQSAMGAKRAYGLKKILGPKLGGSAYIALSQALAIYVSQITELT